MSENAHSTAGCSWRLMLSVLCILLGSACAPTPQPARPLPEVRVIGPETYKVGETFQLNGFEFTVASASFKASIGEVSPYGFATGRKAESGQFMVIDLTMTNLSGQPLQYQFRPQFSVVDELGAKYVETPKDSVLANKGSRTLTGPINPNLRIRRVIAIEVPPTGSYKLQIIVPERAQVGFAGSIKVTGPYCFVDLSQ